MADTQDIKNILMMNQNSFNSKAVFPFTCLSSVTPSLTFLQNFYIFVFIIFFFCYILFILVPNKKKLFYHSSITIFTTRTTLVQFLFRTKFFFVAFVVECIIIYFFPFLSLQSIICVCVKKQAHMLISYVKNTYLSTCSPIRQ